MRATLPVTLFVLAGFALACGGSSTSTPSDQPDITPAPAAASNWHPVKFCEDITNLSQCYDTEKTELSDDDCMMAVSYLAHPQDGACPTEGVSGSCKLADGGVLHYYSRGGEPYDKAKAKEWCKDVKEGTPL